MFHFWLGWFSSTFHYDEGGGITYEGPSSGSSYEKQGQQCQDGQDLQHQELIMEVVVFLEHCVCQGLWIFKLTRAFQRMEQKRLYLFLGVQ